MSGTNATLDDATSDDDVTGSRGASGGRGAGRDGAARVRQLTFVAGVPSHLACVAVGGYPPPEVRLHLGQVGQSISQSVNISVA